MAAKGLFIQLPGVFTPAAGDPALPKFYPNDGILNEGSLFLYDFANPVCYPSQAASLANGTALLNLMTGQPGATVSGSGITYSNGAMILPGGGGNTNFLDLGDNYNMSALGSPNFVVMIYILQDNNYSTTSYQALIGNRTTSTAQGSSQMMMDLGANGGLHPRFGLQSTTASQSVSASANTLNTVTLLALAWEGGVLKGFRNTTLIDTRTLAGPVGAGAATNFKIGAANGFANFKGKVYRAYGENLTLSGKTAAAQIAADYAANIGRFS